MSYRNKIENLKLEGVDIVLDCTGVFKSEKKLAPYFLTNLIIKDNLPEQELLG